MENKENVYFSKYKRKEIKKIMRELKRDNMLLTGYRFLGVLGGFIFRVRDLEFYRYDEFSHNQFLSTARFKVSIEEKENENGNENGSIIKIKEISSVSAIEILFIYLHGLAYTYFVSLNRNLEFISILPKALLIITAVAALLLFIIYCANRYGDRNKGCRDKGEMFLKNRLELEEINKG